MIKWSHSKDGVEQQPLHFVPNPDPIFVGCSFMSGEPIFVDEFTYTDMRDKLSFEYATIWSFGFSAGGPQWDFWDQLIRWG